MKSRYAAAPLLLIALVTTGCSAATEPDTRPSPESSSTIAPITDTPTPEPVTHAVGDTVELSDTSTVAVLGYEPASAPDAPLPEPAGSHWVSIDVQVCNKSNQDAYTNTTPWTLRDSESRSYQSSSVGYDQFPNPQYAWGDVDLFAGDCLRGWITYPVLDGATLVNVRYSPPSGDSRVDWVLE